MAFNVSKNTSPCQFFQLSISQGNLSIKKILAKTIDEWAIAFLSIPDLPNIPPLFLLEDTNRVVFKSAIALKLAASTNLSTVAIADSLVNYLSKLPSIPDPALDFTVEIISSGFIYFHLRSRSLYLWLKLLFERSEVIGRKLLQDDRYLELNNNLTPLTSSLQPASSRSRLKKNVFPLQYTHARCCSILRLAEQEGLIKSKDLDWFGCDRLLVHPAEVNLIFQLLQVTDAIESQQPRDWFKLATSLSQAAIELHRLCPIWDKTHPHFPQLARGRLGLICITQYFLKWLLQEQMGVVAISEL